MRLQGSGVIAATLLAGLAVAGCEAEPEEEAVSIQTVPAEIRDLRITAEATGELEPVLKVEVKSKASGEILELHVDSGDEVEPGTLLAQVDPRDVNNAYEQAEADLAVAQERMNIAQRQLERSDTLLRVEVITAQEYESKQLEYANAQSALVRATTNLELATLRRTDVTIRAPMAGTILEKLVEAGQVIQSATQNVSGGTTLFMMANLDDMRVRTLVDETDMGQLTSGMIATVRVEAFPDRTFQGEIEKIEPQAVVNQNVTMFPVIVLLDNRAGLLKPGMNAEVEVLVDERLQTLTVPNGAVVQPYEVAPAAEVLGLDPQAASVENAAWGELMAQAAARAGVEVEMGGRGGFGRPGAGGGPAAGEMAGIRERMQSGEITADSARVLMAAMREGWRAGGAGGQEAAAATDGSAGAEAPRGDARVAADGDADAENTGAARNGRGAGPGGGWQRAQGAGMGGNRGSGMGMMGAMGGSTGDPALRPAVVFVVDELGNITPRPVVMGIGDYDYAEILAGLEEGEETAMIGAAQLQAQQQERMDRMRGRMRPFGG
ncbi:MAG: efflux RND transporter periplasmic adaptor subunit [Gemmatimonadetes bacterium]|nr:efflux RND transporter periplasmic adaptor subunit [Gemmatimonadota bacterium]